MAHNELKVDLPSSVQQMIITAFDQGALTVAEFIEEDVIPVATEEQAKILRFVVNVIRSNRATSEAEAIAYSDSVGS